MKTDDELQQDVIAELSWDPQLMDVHAQLGVAAKNGVITLSGLVDSYNRKLAAEKAAQRVKGVRVVASDVKVKLGPLSANTDSEIAEAVRSALVWNSAVNQDMIQIKVDSGWVYLEGEVEWAFQRASVEHSIESLSSVIGITNNIKIREKKVDAAALKTQISSAFQRNAAIDANQIRVETSGNNITLYGTVKSWAEMKEAERVAWSSQGVTSVDNQIRLDVEVYA
ncbi:MAG: ornithine aminotransferase [Marivirga sp.]|nr:ornithine aminotransferase [Marivirga sp.]